MRIRILSLLVLAVAAVAGAFGWTGWKSTASGQGDTSGIGLSVEVVPPVEAELAAGPILAVGDLRDGYVHDPALMVPQSPDIDPAPYVDTAWVDTEVTTFATPDPPETPLAPPVSLPPVQLPPHDYSYGFDQPLPSPPVSKGSGPY